MEELYSKIGIWFNENFGENPNIDSVLKKLQEEIGEMETEIDSFQKTWSNHSELTSEFADVVMVMFRLMQALGITYSDLLKAIRFLLGYTPC